MTEFLNRLEQNRAAVNGDIDSTLFGQVVNADPPG
jgi:hypothetical protein